jgi:hypothetical protein
MVGALPHLGHHVRQRTDKVRVHRARFGLRPTICASIDELQGDIAVTDVSVYYFICRKGSTGEGSLSKRRATLEAIRGKGTAVMSSQRVVDHTEVDENGFLIGGACGDSHPVDESWSRIRSFESRARSRADEAMQIADATSGRKTVLLLESVALRSDAQMLKDGIRSVASRAPRASSSERNHGIWPVARKI